MVFELFEFREQIKIGHFFIKLTQFEKTGLLRKVLVPQGNLKKFYFR